MPGQNNRDLRPMMQRNRREDERRAVDSNESRADQSVIDELGLSLPAWPEPRSEAFYGLAGDFVRVVEPHSEADRMALLLHFLVAFGNLIGRGPHRMVEATRHGLNESVLFVGRTAGGRKGTAWKRAQALLTPVDDNWATNCVTGGLSTGEGLIARLQDADDGSLREPRLLAIEPEFARTLRVGRRENATLPTVLRQAWDGDTLRVLTRKDPLEATHHHVSVIAHVTAAELLGEVQRVDAASGYLNRFLIAGARRSKSLPEGGAPEPPGWQDLKRKVSTALDASRLIRELRRSDAARARWAQEYERLTQERPGLLGAVLSRGEAHALRLETIYAVLAGSPTIEVPHLEAALAVWDYSADSAAYVFGDAMGDPIAERIVSGLRAHPAQQLTRTEISALFQHHKPADEIAGALRRLAVSGLVKFETEETGGRPRDVISLISPTTHSTPSLIPQTIAVELPRAPREISERSEVGDGVNADAGACDTSAAAIVSVPEPLPPDGQLSLPWGSA